MALSNLEFTAVMLLAHNGTGFIGNFLVYLLYLTGLFQQDKLIQKWPEKRLVMKALTQYLVESLIVFPLLGYFVLVPIMQMRAAEEFPSVPLLILQLVVIFLSTDFIL
jgi:hypothetical protein